MRKLLRANFARLKKSRSLLLCAVAALAVSTLFLINIRVDNEDLTVLDEIIMQVPPFLPILYAVFASLFLGAEYQDGTMRNKLIAGHRRAAVYAANLIVVTVGCCIILAGWALSIIIGMIKFGGFVQPLGALAVSAAVILLQTAAFAAILTLAGMLISNRAVSAVTAILLILCLLGTASSIYGSLSEPEMTSPIVITDEGFENGDPEPNPDYVSGARRQYYQLAVDVLPTGQAILLANGELARPAVSLCGSAGICLLTSAIGIAIFKRRDLK